MALGASRAAIARLVAAHSARLASIGAAVGVAAATASLGILGSLVPLRNVTWIDLPAIVAGLVLVGIAAAAATVVPTLRATRIAPASTLRSDG